MHPALTRVRNVLNSQFICNIACYFLASRLIPAIADRYVNTLRMEAFTLFKCTFKLTFIL
jgi:phage gp36-like protein